MTQKIYIGLLAVAVILLGVIAYGASSTKQFGASADQTTNWTAGAFSSDLTVGGTLTTTGASAMTGATTLTGGAKVGSTGTLVKRIISASSTWDIPAVGAGACTSTVRTVTGATTDDALASNFANAISALTSTTRMAWISAANTVTFKVCNFGDSATADPAAGVIRATVFGF